MSRIEIPVLAEERVGTRFYATLEGTTPLLMHKPNLQVADGEVRRTGDKKIPLPADEAEAGAYRLQDGTLMAPVRWIQRNLTEAGKAFQNPANKKQTMMRVIAASLLPPDVEGYPLLREGVPLTDYEIDIQRVSVQRAAVMRARPRIDTPWSIEVQMELDLDPFYSGADVPDEKLADVGALLLQVMRHAGSKLGLGDFRPEKTGHYGRYTVTSFSVERD